jgi:alpha-tubulin suppressor-like RCC1 family protein
MAAQTLYAWGDFGEHGAVSPQVDAPTVIHGIRGTVAQVVASNSATYVLLTNGQVWAFGANGFGELGQGYVSSYTMTPVQVPLPPIASLPSSMPYATGLAISATGRIYGWGSNNGGELCKGSVSEFTKPVQLPFANVTLATGAGQHASYLSNGTLYSCGMGGYGQLGNGAFTQSLSPVRVALEGIVGLYSSYADTAALLSDGSYYDWGNNSAGQLGDNAPANANSDVPVEWRTTSSQPQSAATIG